MTTLNLRNSISRSPLRRAWVLFPLVCICFALSPTAQAVSPEPDGCYPNFTTAEGCRALDRLTTGAGNTGLGWRSLFFTTTGSNNTAVGNAALHDNTTGTGNTAIGTVALAHNTTGFLNTAIGNGALDSNTTGSDNMANGNDALFHNTTGNHNVANGFEALLSNTTGTQNTADGARALRSNTTGSGNIALGNEAGSNLTGGSSNVDIGNEGVAGDGNTIRIGNASQTKTFIAGISGAAVTGAAVQVNAAGELGTAPSSERFKDQIKQMDKTSEAVLALKPVTFRYKTEIDPAGMEQFGLIAEEVEKVNRDLVVRDKEGKPYSVRYDAVNAMLLNEFLKEHKTMQEQGATIARQQKQIEALTTGLQKMSAQIEVSKPAPQTALNNR